MAVQEAQRRKHRHKQPAHGVPSKFSSAVLRKIAQRHVLYPLKGSVCRVVCFENVGYMRNGFNVLQFIYFIRVINKFCKASVKLNFFSAGYTYIPGFTVSV